MSLQRRPVICYEITSASFASTASIFKVAQFWIFHVSTRLYEVTSYKTENFGQYFEKEFCNNWA